VVFRNIQVTWNMLPFILVRIYGHILICTCEIKSRIAMSIAAFNKNRALFY